MTEKERLHTLVEELPEPEVHTALRFLEYLNREADPLAQALAEAPFDDEPVTAADLEALREGLEEHARGDSVPHEEVKRLIHEQK